MAIFKMEQSKYKVGYWLPGLSKRVHITKNQEIDSNSDIGVELLTHHGDLCVVDGVRDEDFLAKLNVARIKDGSKTQIQLAEAVVKGSGALTTEQTATLTKLVGIESPANGIDKSVKKTDFFVTPDIISTVDKTGVTNSVAAFQELVSYGKDIVCKDGIYLLSGGGDIEIPANADFSGSIFINDGWTGNFKISNKVDLVTYTSGDTLFDKFVSSNSLIKGSTKANGLWNDTELNDTYIQIDTTSPFYNYREIAQSRRGFNKIFKNGHLGSPIDYDFNLSEITALHCYKMNQTFTEIKGLTIIEKNYGASGGGVHINSTKVNLINTSFIINYDSLTENALRVVVENSSDINITNLYGSAVNEKVDDAIESEYTYTLQVSSSYNVVFDNIISDGKGWGAVGNNDCQRVEFKNSQLNRIDFHKPCREWLKVNNCTVGEWGILLSIIGDLIINDTEFVARIGTDKDAIIGTRADVGGFADGNLIMNNCTIKGNDGVSERILLSHSYSTNCGIVDSLSPIKNTFFNNIIIDGLIVDESISILNIVSSSTSQSIEIAKNIELRGIKLSTDLSKIDLDDFSLFDTDAPVLDNQDFSQQYTHTISISDSRTDYIYNRNDDSDKFLNFEISNVNPYSFKGLIIVTKQFSSWKISKTPISSIRTYSSGYASANILFNMCQSDLIMEGNPSGEKDKCLVDIDATKHKVFISSSDILIKEDSTQGVSISKAKLSNVRLIDELGNDKYILLGVATLGQKLTIGSEYLISSGSGGTLQYTNFKYNGYGRYKVVSSSGDIDFNINSLTITVNSTSDAFNGICLGTV